MKRKQRIPFATILAFCSIFVQTPVAKAQTVPTKAILLYQQGLQLYRQNPQKALADFAQSAKLAPWWEPPVYEEGQLLAVSDFNRAIGVLLHAAKLAPHDDTVWNILGWGYYQHGKFAEAIQAFLHQLSLAKNSVNARWGLANCYDNSAVRQFAKARQQLLLLVHDPVKGALAKKLLVQLPPDAIDLSVQAAKPITYEDAIAVALSYRNNILSTPAKQIFAQNGKPESPSVAPYITWAYQHGLLADLAVPSFQAPATRLFIALLLAKLYGINRYDYLRPFALTDMQSVSVNDQMTVNSILANRLLHVVSTGQFAPFSPIARSEFAKVISNANTIMKNPPTQNALLTPPAPAASAHPFVYFFATSQPDIAVQNADIALHQTRISAIGLTYYPFIADFPQGSAKTRQAIDHTQFLLTAMSAGSAVQNQLQSISADGIKPFMVLANYNNVTHAADPGIVDALLSSPTKQSALIAEIVHIVAQEKLQGVTVDFENILAKDRMPYVAFLQGLHEKLQAIGATTMICLPERDQSTGHTSAYDYRLLGQNADLVMLITYDEHVPSTKPGTIAALFNDQRVIQYALEQIPAQKILLGAADYGYDWSQGGGVEVSMQQAEQLAATYHATVTLDTSSQTPTFTYKDASGTEHTVWFENQASLTKVDNLVQTFGLRGIAVWHLGADNSEFWNALP